MAGKLAEKKGPDVTKNVHFWNRSDDPTCITPDKDGEMPTWHEC
jgi:hypothetical protein